MRFALLAAGFAVAGCLTGCGGGGGGGGATTRAIKVTPLAAAFFIDNSRVVLGVPSGSVSSDRVIPYSTPTALPTDSRYVPNTAISFDDSSFSKPLSLTLGYVPASLPAGAQRSELRIARLVGSSWIEVPDSVVSEGDNAVHGFTSSLGTFGIIVKNLD